MFPLIGRPGFHSPDVAQMRKHYLLVEKGYPVRISMIGARFGWFSSKWMMLHTFATLAEAIRTAVQEREDISAPLTQDVCPRIS
jgi:hypothetical protein